MTRFNQLSKRQHGTALAIGRGTESYASAPESDWLTAALTEDQKDL